MRSENWLVEQLPFGMVDDDFLVRYLKIMQTVSNTVLHQTDGMEHLFDPAVAPDNMVRLMAEWFGVDWVDSDMSDRLQREIVLRYREIIQWRGTRRGLEALMEVLTGAPANVTDSGGVFAEGESPDGAPGVMIALETQGWNRFEDLVQIIVSELPANTVLDLWIAGERVWSSSIDLERGTAVQAQPSVEIELGSAFAEVTTR